MKQALNDEVLDQVVGGTVNLNTNAMMIGFTVLGESFQLKNCTDTEAMILVVQLYSQYKKKGNLAFETATKEAFAANGWI